MKFAQLTTEAEIRDLIAYHNEFSDVVALDTETTSKDARTAALIDVQLTGVDKDEAITFSGEHAHLLLSLNVLQVWHNFKYDWKVLYRHGVDLRGKSMRDTMLLSHLHNENRNHDLDGWVQELFADPYKAEFWAKYKSYSEAPRDEQLEYGGKDVIYTLRLYRVLLEKLRCDGIY